TFAELLARVRQEALNALAHQDLPFEQLVDTIEAERDRSRTPVFQALFNYYEQRDAWEAADEGAATQLATAAVEVPGIVTAKFDLRLMFTEHQGGLSGAVEYSTGLFDKSTMERFVAHLFEFLQSVTTAPETRLSAVSLLSVDERR